MRINFSCPISGEQRDNTTARVVAGFVLLITGIGLYIAGQISIYLGAIIIGLLFVDFITRAFIKPKYSLLATLARGIVSGLNLPKNMVDGAPKVFAARIGVVFSAVGAILYTINLFYAGTIVLTILLICAALESLFGFCLGCWMYSLIPKKLGRLLSKQFIK